MYKFKNPHLHTFADKPLTGTTTVFKVLSKEKLIPWAVSKALDYVAKNSGETGTGEYIVTPETLEAAQDAWMRDRDSAGVSGTKVHKEIEEYIKYRLTHERMKKPPEMPSKQAQLFRVWAEQNVDRFLFSELHVFSREHWVGGIIDFGYVDTHGKGYLGDIKTSKSIYPEQFWQCAAYEMQLFENGGYTPDGELIYSQETPLEGVTIVNLPKQGGIKVESSYGYEDNLQAFLACLTIYRMREKLEQALGK